MHLSETIQSSCCTLAPGNAHRMPAPMLMPSELVPRDCTSHQLRRVSVIVHGVLDCHTIEIQLQNSAHFSNCHAHTPHSIPNPKRFHHREPHLLNMEHQLGSNPSACRDKRRHKTILGQTRDESAQASSQQHITKNNLKTRISF